MAVGGGHYLTNIVAFPSVTFPRVTLATQQVSKITEHLSWYELWWTAPEMVQSPTEIPTIKGIYKDKPLRAPRDGALGQPRGTGWGRWEGGSGGGGTTSIVVADSHWRMAKTTTVLWSNYPPIKINKKKKKTGGNTAWKKEEKEELLSPEWPPNLRPLKV